MTTANKSKKDTMEMLMKRTGEHSIKREDTIRAALNELRKAELVTFDRILLEIRPSPYSSEDENYRNLWRKIFGQLREECAEAGERPQTAKRFKKAGLEIPKAFEERFSFSKGGIPLGMSMSGFADEVEGCLRVLRENWLLTEEYLDSPSDSEQYYEDQIFTPLFCFLTLFQMYQSKYHGNHQ